MYPIPVLEAVFEGAATFVVVVLLAAAEDGLEAAVAATLLVDTADVGLVLAVVVVVVVVLESDVEEDGLLVVGARADTCRNNKIGFQFSGKLLTIDKTPRNYFPAWVRNRSISAE